MHGWHVFSVPIFKKKRYTKRYISKLLLINPVNQAWYISIGSEIKNGTLLDIPLPECDLSFVFSITFQQSFSDVTPAHTQKKNLPSHSRFPFKIWMSFFFVLICICYHISLLLSSISTWHLNSIHHLFLWHPSSVSSTMPQQQIRELNLHPTL